MDIVNVGYASTNYYVLGQRNPRLLIDVGWPGTLPKLLANLKRKDIPFQEIRYLLVTHYHPDHAGLAQEVKDKGVRLIVIEPQVDAIPILKTYMKPVNPHVEIRLDDNFNLSIAGSRKFLLSIRIEGEILHTPGHSADSVTLILDSSAAFTGDALSPGKDEQSQQAITRNWEQLRSLNITTLYPGHGIAGPLRGES
jgi:ribonuclease/clavin/mitogillin